MSRKFHRAASAAPAPQETLEPLVSVHDDAGRGAFEIVKATGGALREQAYRLRYQAYCIENRFEDAARYPDGLETDEFDSHAVQSLLIHRASGAPAGVVRLILPLAAAPERSFPIQRVCRAPELLDPQQFPVPVVGEVSRFCISKAFRKRREDALDDADTRRIPSPHERRVAPHLTLGLVEALIVMSIEHGIAYWCALMEPAFLRLLGRLGIHFDPLGPMIDHHGIRQPCLIRLDRMLRRAAAENPATWNILTDHGNRWDAVRLMPALRGVGAGQGATPE